MVGKELREGGFSLFLYKNSHFSSVSWQVSWLMGNFKKDGGQQPQISCYIKLNLCNIWVNSKKNTYFLQDCQRHMKFCPGFFTCSVCELGTVNTEGGKLTDGPWTCIGTGVTGVLCGKIQNKEDLNSCLIIVYWTMQDLISRSTLPVAIGETIVIRSFAIDCRGR